MKNTISRTTTRFLVLTLLCSLFFSLESSAKKIYITKGSDGGQYIDGKRTYYAPGDTLVVSSSQGTFSYISFESLNGSASQPIVVLNEGGQVTLTQGFKFTNCTYVKLTGSGSSTQYGFKVETFPTNGVGIEVTDRSANFEIERCLINSKTYGFWIKKEGTCDANLNYPNWRLENISIHDNKITNIGQEAMYLGSTGPNGERPVVCNGVTTYPKPMRLGNIKVYNNIIDHTDRGGIQLSGADFGLNEIYNNTITNAGYEMDPAQGNGIVLGGYSQAYIHDNTVMNTYSTGIFSLGAGEVRIENNRVENSGMLNGATANGMANIMVDTRITDPAKNTTFIIQNNRVSGNTDKHIRVYNSFPTFSLSGNVICNNTLVAGGPVNIGVPLGINYTNCSPSNQPPVPNAGPDQMLNLPLNTAQLNGTATDADGLVTSYTWTKISGPDQFTISNANIANPSVSNLAVGVYKFRLTVFDNSGATEFDEMTITVNNPSSSSYKLIPAKLEAEAWDLMWGVQTENTSDAGGGLSVGYIDNDDWMEYNVNVPATGTYTIQFRVATTNTGAKFTFNKQDGTGITLNVPQTGGYQSWQTISATLSLMAGQQTLRLTSRGNAWNFNWLQFISNTTGGTPVTGEVVTTKVQAENWSSMQGVQTENTSDVNNGLNVGYIDNGDWMEYSLSTTAAGNYSFSFRVATPGTGGQLQVRKTDGTVLSTVTIPNTGGWQTWQNVSGTVALASGTQTIRIISTGTGNWNFNWFEYTASNTPVNVAPTANAGADATIQLPVSSVQLNGSGTDGDGTISRYGWAVVSGPSQYTLSSTTVANPVLSNLVAGTYVLRLTVTDNSEGTASDEVTITVNASATVSSTIRIEAENWSGMSGVQKENTSDAGGGQNVGYIDNNDWMDYALNISTTGTYTVSFRVASPNNGMQLQLKRADGSVLASVNIPNTGGYQNWQTVSANVSLTAGQQTLRVQSVGNNWNINWLEFAQSTSTPVVTASQKVEAENWKSMQGVQTEKTADAGGGLDVGYIDNGDWMEYEVNPASSGTYTMNFRVATPNSGGQLLVKKADGTTLGTLNIPVTGGWQTWQTATTTLSLAAGVQNLRIVSATGTNWNINWFELVAGTATPPPSGETATTIKVEAENWSGMIGVQTENASDAGGGLNVGYIDNGEWMDYNLNITAAGTYVVSFRVASMNTGAQIQLKTSSGTVLTTVSLPNTGGWQTWQTVTSTVTLSAGQQTFRIQSVGANYNINWFEFAPSTTAATVTARQVVGETVVISSYAAVFPNNVKDRFALKVSNELTGAMTVQITDADGKVQKQFTLNKAAAGTTQTYLSAAGLAAGEYSVQVKMKDWTQTTRMIKL